MKVFYDPRQSVANADSFSPSAGKPVKALESWERLGFSVERMSFQPLRPADIALAHDRTFVDDVLSCRRANGFGNVLSTVAASLPYTTGSFYAAARHAVIHKESCASPTSGFHHACYDSSGGFCTFNGLMVAAIKLLKDLRVGRVGVLDIDAHYGNGTVNIMDRLEVDQVVHYTFGADALAEKETSGQWLTNFPTVLERFKDCDVILYQAGADPHVNDPLGGVLTTQQMFERDRLVFDFCHRSGIPVAWNLAGGYQDPLRRVLDLHDNTARAFAEVYGGT